LFCLFSIEGSALSATQMRVDVDPEKSFFLAIARRDGVLSFLAHDHSILAKKWTAAVCRGDKQAQIKVRIETNSLVIDTPDALAKGQVESKISSSDRNSLQEKIMSPRFLNAAEFPQITFESKSVEKRGASQWLAKGTLDLHGIQRPVSVLIRQEGRQIYGDFSIKQSDFGIEPESIAGVVKVRDELEIRFILAIKSTGAECL